MTAQAVVRRAALAASVMAPDAVERLLASLEPEMASRLKAAMAVVRQHGWDRCDWVEKALDGEATTASLQLAGRPVRLDVIARHLDGASYARVLAAKNMDQRGFHVSLLERDFAAEVERELAAVPVLPERLRAATLAAAEALDSMAMGVAD